MLLLAIAAIVVGVVAYEIASNRHARAQIKNGRYSDLQGPTHRDNPAYAYYVPIGGR